MQDIPAIARAAHARGCVVIGDNTWATPLYVRAFELGMDVSIHSATKYIGGHSDLVMGVAMCKEAHYAPLLRTFRNTGMTPSGDNCFLALRGLRSMSARLKQHDASGMAVAQWLQQRPEVEAVIHPALPGAAGHDIWKRDFSGACGLFAFVLREGVSHAGLAAMLDHMELFGMGYSWGGYESLITPVNLYKARTATVWPHKGQLMRLHVGLEYVDDLLRDLEAGFERLRQV
jgi:cystathionine beta-lyase